VTPARDLAAAQLGISGKTGERMEVVVDAIDVAEVCHVNQSTVSRVLDELAIMQAHNSSPAPAPRKATVKTKTGKTYTR